MDQLEATAVAAARGILRALGSAAADPREALCNACLPLRRVILAALSLRLSLLLF